jgi:hypothetical protein
MSFSLQIHTGTKNMFKNFRDKIALSGITVLMIGITLLIFTFVSAYGFLTAGLSINASGDLTQTFGDALAPLIVTCIHIMYLGVMGWVGSLITIRGVTIIAHAPPMPTLVQSQQPTPEAKLQPHPQTQQLPQKPKTEKPKAEKPMEEKPKEEVKVPEPEIIVLPPEQVAQTPPTPEQKPQQNGSPTQ